MIEDEHRGFPRDPACRPIDVFVQDQIAPDRHFFLRKTVDNLNKVLFVFFQWTFVTDFYQIRPKRSMPPELKIWMSLSAFFDDSEFIFEAASNPLQKSLAITFEVKKKWGTASTSIVGSHYFHDFQ